MLSMWSDRSTHTTIFSRVLIVLGRSLLRDKIIIRYGIKLFSSPPADSDSGHLD